MLTHALGQRRTSRQCRSLRIGYYLAKHAVGVGSHVLVFSNCSSERAIPYGISVIFPLKKKIAQELLKHSCCWGAPAHSSVARERHQTWPVLRLQIIISLLWSSVSECQWLQEGTLEIM